MNSIEIFICRLLTMEYMEIENGICSKRRNSIPICHSTFLLQVDQGSIEIFHAALVHLLLPPVLAYEQHDSDDLNDEEYSVDPAINASTPATTIAAVPPVNVSINGLRQLSYFFDKSCIISAILLLKFLQT